MQSRARIVIDQVLDALFDRLIVCFLFCDASKLHCIYKFLLETRRKEKEKCSLLIVILLYDIYETNNHNVVFKRRKFYVLNKFYIAVCLNRAQEALLTTWVRYVNLGETRS
jgi:hypothetical protein